MITYLMSNKIRIGFYVILLATGAVAIRSFAYAGYMDPQGSGIILSAVNWLYGAVLGTIATVVALITLASVGVMMLTGSINWRLGAVAILGCIIGFCLTSIVAGIRSVALGG